MPRGGVTRQGVVLTDLQAHVDYILIVNKFLSRSLLARSLSLSLPELVDTLEAPRTCARVTVMSAGLQNDAFALLACRIPDLKHFQDEVS